MRLKYEFIEENKLKISEQLQLRQIRALIDFGSIRRGDIGGFIESELNCPHEDDSWVPVESALYGNMKAKILKPIVKPPEQIAPQSAPVIDQDVTIIASNKVRIGNRIITLTDDQMEELKMETHYKIGDLLIEKNIKTKKLSIYKAKKDGKIKSNMRKVKEVEIKIYNEFFRKE